MSEAITDSAGLNGPVVEIPAPKRRSASGTRATKKVAEKAPVENVSVEAAEETTTDEGQEVIAAPKAKRTRRSNSFTTDTGAIGSRAADAALSKKVDTTKKEAKKEEEKVAVWSDKNIRWAGVGTLSKGYNIITKEAATVWMTREGIREATPEEVASYYSN